VKRKEKEKTTPFGAKCMRSLCLDCPVPAHLLPQVSGKDKIKNTKQKKETKRIKTEKTTPFGVTLMRSHVSYRAAQGSIKGTIY